MKYVVEFDRDEMFEVLVALQCDADRLEGIALGQREEEMQNRFMQKSQNRITLYKKILDTYKVVE